MKTRLKQFVVVAILAAVAFSCSDDDSESISVSAALTGASKGWIVTAATISPAFLGVSDLYAQYDACDKDDATFFTSDGKYKIENTVKCDASEGAILETGTWTLTSDNKVLKMTDSSSDSEEFNVAEATTSTLKVNQVVESGGVKYTISLTMTAK